MGNPNMMSPVGRGGLMPHDGRMPSGGQVPGQLGSSVSCRIHKGGMYSRRLRTGRIRSNLRCHQCCNSRVRRRNLPPVRVHPRHRCRGMLRPRNNLLGCSSRRFPGNHSLCNNRRYRSNHNPCNGHLGRGKFHSKSRSKADRIAIPILRLVWWRLNHRIIVSTCYPIESSISCSASYRCSSCSCPAFLGALVPVVCAASSYWQWCCLWSVWLESFTCLSRRCRDCVWPKTWGAAGRLACPGGRRWC